MTFTPDERDLIQADLDGTATDLERAALREREAKDPRLAEEVADLRWLSGTLARVDEISPPADLAEGILRAIRTAPAAGTRGFLARLRGSLPAYRSLVPYAYAAAVGAAACFLALQAVGWGIPGEPAVTSSEAAGAMAPVEGELLGSVDLSGSGVSGVASLREAGSRLAVDIALGEEYSGAIGIRFDPDVVEVVGISSPGSRLGRLDVASGLVSFTRPPDGRVTVLLARRGSDPASVSLGAVGPDGELREAGTLPLPPGR